jgi:hypothetical protein
MWVKFLAAKLQQRQERKDLESGESCSKTTYKSLIVSLSKKWSIFVLLSR